MVSVTMDESGDFVCTGGFKRLTRHSAGFDGGHVWAHPAAVRSERIVETMCRLSQAIDLIIAANGAKVRELDNRKGRLATKPFSPPRIELVEELTELK